MEAPRPHMPAQRPLMVVLFLLLAASTQLLLALYGLLSRFVQVKPSPPLPALRLVVVCNLIGEAALVAFHLAPLLLARLWRRWRQGEGVLELPLHAPRREALRSAAGNTAPCAAPAKQTADSSPSESIIVGGDGSSDSSDGQPCINTNALQPPAAAKAEPPAPAHSSVRAPVPLVRGMTFRMERWQQRRPEAHRRLALAAIVASFTGVCSLQILAPGFVDVSIVQLTTQWTTLAIALTQALLLRHHLPRAFWPCATFLHTMATAAVAPRALFRPATAARPGRRSLRVQAGSALALPDNITKVMPKGDLVLARVPEAEEKTTGGILLPGAAQARPTSGDVVALGDGQVGTKQHSFALKGGETVLYSRFGIGATELEVGGQLHILIREDDLIGIMPRSNATAADIPDLRPLGDRVLIKVQESADVTMGGVILPDSAKERPLSGTVVRAGPGKMAEDGERKAPKVAEGDRVIYFKYAGDAMETPSGEKYTVIHESDILAKL